MNDLKWEWESSVPRAQGQAYLYEHPRLPDPVPPPSPVGVYGNGRA